MKLVEAAESAEMSMMIPNQFIPFNRTSNSEAPIANADK
jgi:hypothetical protein